MSYAPLAHVSYFNSFVSQPAAPAKPPAKRSKKKFDSEDYCMYCRDGGEVVLCARCPRGALDIHISTRGAMLTIVSVVFHPRCHGMTKAEVARSISIACSQHNCAVCNRSTADAGGMLFRCQTCPQAFCEDCLPNDDFDAVGDVLPEFLLLGLGQQNTAYYIRCHDCHAHFKEDPAVWEAWQEEMKETQAKLKSLEASL